MKILYKKIPALSYLVVLILLGGCSATPDNTYFPSATREEIIAMVEIQSSDFDSSVQVSGPKVEQSLKGDVKTQTLSLRTKLDVQAKTVAHQMVIDLSTRVPTAAVATWSYFDRARLNVGSLTRANSLSRETISCDDEGCLNKELLTLNLTKSEVGFATREGLQATLFSDDGRSYAVTIPANYVKAYVAAINRTLVPGGLTHSRMGDANSLGDQEKFARGFSKAEAMAKSINCKHQTLKTISSNGPLSVFQVECPGERFSLIKCQWGNCQVLK